MTYLAKNQWPVSFLLTYDKFVGTQSHAFAHTGDEECVCNRQKREILTETEVVGMKKDNGLVGECGKTRIDARDDVQYPSVRLVLFGGLQGDLDQGNLLVILCVFIEECLEREQFMAHALKRVMSDIPLVGNLQADLYFIELVAANNEFYACIPLF